MWLVALSLLVWSLVLTGCDKPKVGSGEGAEKVLAVVNGRPITALEVDSRLMGGHGSTANNSLRPGALDKLIEEELLVRYGEEQGLDQDKKFQKMVQETKLRLEATSRRELTRRVFNHEMTKIKPATDEELKAYFEAKKERIQTALHLANIPFRDRAEAEAALVKIKNGENFETIASLSSPNHKPGKDGKKPWDLGLLEWYRIPPEWEDALYALQPGEVSGVVEGARIGTRIFKLIKREPRPNLDFNGVRPALQNRMREKKHMEMRESLIKRLKEDAKIERAKAP